jgi:hypothetical protein
MADPKTPPPPVAVPEGTVFVKNPGGAVHDMSEDDPRTATIIEQAKGSNNGWKLASDAEIAVYCETNNLIAPKGKKDEPRAATAAEERGVTAAKKAGK